jgi:hypothetical protein
MNLEGVARVKAAYDNMDDEQREDIRALSDKSHEFIEKNFPALCTSDRAAIAWFTSELTTALLSIPISRISDVIKDTAAAYALTTVDLMGWND